MPFDGRTVIKSSVIIGASKGIGASIAEHLAAEGASIVVNYASSNETGMVDHGQVIVAAGGIRM